MTAETTASDVSSARALREVVLVTGASSGIGRASAIQFAERGASLVLVSRSATTLADAAADCRAAGAAAVECVPADVLDPDAVQAAVDRAVQTFGRLDVVVHAATVMAYGRIEDVPADVFERVVDTAVLGTFHVFRSALPVLRSQQRGHVVVVSSLLASITAPTMGAYVTAKWGQLGLIRTLQQELRELPDVHVSAVAPGGVTTPIYDQAATVLGNTGHPPPPVYTPERVARAVVSRIDAPRRLKQSGFANPLIITGFRLFPPVFDALVGPLLKVFGMARDAVPPTTGNVFAPVPEKESTRGTYRGI
ncbi:SDR family NAD(P)-dependent oxidoreductase [Modestobacter versicolor]|uniref:NAD(P)-dependent dehydrogenase (Short-subunit alcohol dehydrogenase family) n=1 Tax=Modestobacter versicolor TaxID=429133 RepID=A0A323VBX6_9ACTN|nr:SDR family NAD(P)-dependent oxidoreductase [Modestobacter versicolor]MBB3677638.1 NAD(P)-dependent dehydrogenase (short-subunit alcohol dehydrogenase family) [Modestobacter versicolor]PZA22199.1 short-chain dehydrogenase [Modestobacter versicolor]